MLDSKTEKVAGIIRGLQLPEIKKLLVVGCGSGIEAAILATELNTHVTGIDLKNNFDHEAETIANLRTGDAMALEFAENTFDFVFSYHALEHIDDPSAAVAEIARVLKAGGGFWIGTPNRSRIIGYIGAKGASFKDKLFWNWIDLKARLKGEFRNEFGAHAGFTSQELGDMIRISLPDAKEVTTLYFQTVYPSHLRPLKMIRMLGISWLVFPSVYFIGVKKS
jgi:SAM-dependent methyltransferase